MVDYVYVVVFSFIGASLGYWVLRYKEDMTRGQAVTEYVKSVLVGVFTAIIIYTVLIEETGRGHNISTVVSGGVAFGGTEAMRILWEILLEKFKRKLDL